MVTTDGAIPSTPLLADSVGIALLVVLESLEPAERLAFVLHDMFAVPFNEIAPIVERTPQPPASSRAEPEGDSGARQPSQTPTCSPRRVVNAFLAASRAGDFEELLPVLDPDVVLRADGGPTGLSRHIRGAEPVASQALLWARVDLTMRRALINGAAGIVTFRRGRPFSIAAITVKNGKIAEIDFLADPDRSPSSTSRSSATSTSVFCPGAGSGQFCTCQDQGQEHRRCTHDVRRRQPDHDQQEGGVVRQHCALRQRGEPNVF